MPEQQKTKFFFISKFVSNCVGKAHCVGKHKTQALAIDKHSNLINVTKSKAKMKHR